LCNRIKTVRIQKRHWFSLAALALIGLLVFFLLPPAEPIVNGHPLSYWIDEARDEDLNESPEVIQSALSAMDDRCIRALINEVNWTPSPRLQEFENFSERWVHVDLPIHNAPDRRQGAALLLGQLGSRASNAIPALDLASRRWVGDPEAGTRARASAIAALILIRHDSVEPCAKKSLDYGDPVSYDYSAAIHFLGTNAASCVPMFVDAMQTTTNYQIRRRAVNALGSIHSRPELTVPALEALLKSSTDRNERMVALFGIADFGSAAKPVLVRYQNDSDESIRAVVDAVIGSIDLSPRDR